MHILMAASEDNFILEIFLNGCFSKTAAKYIVSATYGSRDPGIVLENLSSSRFFLFFLSKCYRGQTRVRKSVVVQIFFIFS